MMVTMFAFFAWIYFAPFNYLLGSPPATFPNPFTLIIDTIIFAPIWYFVVRKWLRTMTKRKGGPAAGIDVVEPGSGIPEPGDEWGRATRPYRAGEPSKIIGPKSELRESIGIDAGFFVKLPDIDTGEEIFEPKELLSRAMIRSTVSSGGWVQKRISSRAMGSLKTSDSSQQGRPFRARLPPGAPRSINLPATIRAALARIGRYDPAKGLRILPQDVRESVFTGRVPLTVLLVIDVSMSMKGALSEVRKILRRIETETRGSKDRIGIIAFKDSGAVEVQAPTTNWNKVYRALARLKISGLSPLAEAMMKSLETVKRERMKNRDVEPLIVMISDFAPNIPLAQSVGPGHARYTPVKDLVKAARLVRKANVRIATINVEKEQAHWSKFLKRPYHEALELATTLRMRKEGFYDIIETILAVPEFRNSFSSFLVARVGGGRTFLYREVMEMRSVLGTFLSASVTRARLRSQELKEAESYIRW
ncbi:MAG: VWA domain-containing protein [Candidatus Thorarchaeota archaeon]